jgi:hypothetical protein
MQVKVYLDRKARKKINLMFLPCDQQLFRSKKPLRFLHGVPELAPQRKKEKSS